MITMMLGAMYAVSIYCMTLSAYETISTTLKVFDAVMGKVTLAWSFRKTVYRMTAGIWLFIVSVILTLIRYGIFKV